MSSRDLVLARIRRAVGDPESVPVVREYRHGGDLTPGGPELLDLLEDRLVDYRAAVRRTTPAGIAAAVRSVLDEHHADRVAVPAGLDPGWVPGATVDDGTLSADELDELDAVVTGCAVAIAETGTIVLDASPDQGRRIISLIPDLHVCIVASDDVVQLVPEALTRLDPQSPMTLISGPSATSDIELQRVEGVHGPRRLEVVLVDSRQ